jgi:hypothetical protein
MFRFRRAAVSPVAVSALSLVFAACDDGGSPASKVAAPTLAQLHVEVLKPSCTFSACHAGPNPKAGLDLTTLDAAHAALVGAPSRDGTGVRVVAGNAEESLLYQVLLGPTDSARQMPLGFELDAAVIEQVKAWIDAGAPKGDPNAVIDPNPIEPEPIEDPNAPKPSDLPAPDPADGFQMGIDTSAEPGQEIWKCVVADLPTEDLSAVNRVQAIQSPGVHHMDVMALGLLNLPIEPGMYDCDDLYSQHAEMMEEGIFLFATQNQEETLQLPSDTAALIPAGLRVMVEIHYVNPTPRRAEVWSRINAYTMPMRDAKKQIWGSAVRTVDIDIPAKTERHYEWVRCEMNRDVDVIILSSHTHQLAEYVDVYLWDGEKRGELVYENDDWHAPMLKQFQTPIARKAGTGFEFRCHYRNPGEDRVTWGFGANDEMCQIGFVHTPMDTEAACVPVEIGRGPELP